MKYTMKDVAKACNTSTATVSMVLAGKDKRISAGTRELIKKTAIAMDYYPNSMASSLAKKKSKYIGIVVNDLRNSHIAELFMSINEVLQEKGFLLICHVLNGKIDDSTEILAREIASENISALMWARPLEPNNDKDNGIITSVIKSMDIPVFTMDQYEFECPGVNVCFDYENAGYLATKYLIDNGHKKIGCVTGNIGYKVTIDRLNGYKKALCEAGIPYDDNVIFKGNYMMESGSRGLPYLLGQGVTAVFAQNDEMAFGLYKAARTYGIRIPEDLSIVGCDNVEFDESLEVPLSTIEVPIVDMGHYLAEMICKYVNDGNENERATKFYAPKLLVRGSVKKVSH